MKKLILIMCLVAVSGFASYCSSELHWLNQKIKEYNRDCANKRLYGDYEKSKCDRLKEQIDEYRYKLEYCRERRNDDIANKFKYYR